MLCESPPASAREASDQPARSRGVHGLRLTQSCGFRAPQVFRLILGRAHRRWLWELARGPLPRGDAGRCMRSDARGRGAGSRRRSWDSRRPCYSPPGYRPVRPPIRRRHPVTPTRSRPAKKRRSGARARGCAQDRRDRPRLRSVRRRRQAAHLAEVANNNGKRSSR